MIELYDAEGKLVATYDPTQKQWPAPNQILIVETRRSIALDAEVYMRLNKVDEVPMQ